jgi:hypothetical protein
MNDRVPHWTERLVRALDDGLRIPGTSIGVGLDALVGFVLPGAGDAITALSGLALFYAAYQHNVPKRVLARMALNVAIDLVLGSIPLAGDAFDLLWKSNRKNLQLIERHRQEPEAPPRLRDYVLLALAVALMVVALAVPVLLLGLGVSWALSLYKSALG